MDLHTLIATHKNGQSYQKLADKSNGTINQKSFQTIATQAPRAFPAPGTIRGLSTALKVSEEEVILAYAESLGLCHYDPTSTHETRAIAGLQEQVFYWQNHAATYRGIARGYKWHFEKLQPIAQNRPWLIAGTQHQANHMQSLEMS